MNSTTLFEAPKTLYINKYADHIGAAHRSQEAANAAKAIGETCSALLEYRLVTTDGKRPVKAYIIRDYDRFRGKLTESYVYRNAAYPSGYGFCQGLDNAERFATKAEAEAVYKRMSLASSKIRPLVAKRV